MVRLLLIDDDTRSHLELQVVLGDRYHVCSAETGASGIVRARVLEPDVVLLDVDLPDMSGIEVLARLDHHRTPVVMLSSYGDTRLVVEAVRAGAFDYVLKTADPSVLHDALGRAVAASAFRRIADEHPKSTELARIVGSSVAIRGLRDLVVACSRADSPVCVLGESGTGKELVAQAIHRLSARGRGPFVPVNCGAIPETLTETELFGSERGAFTDAASRPGSFERAHRGTLFLDEIGEMSASAQVKLLRAVEQKRILRVGGTEELSLDVRIVAATNRDLKAEVASHRFREDLFYRVGVLVVPVPPLRDRMEDVPLLALHFLRELSGGEIVPELSPEAAERLMVHTWPGNVRELRNVIERALLLSRSNGTDGHVVPAECIVLY
jgi:DNA-binding NtrC family response regulator